MRDRPMQAFGRRGFCLCCVGALAAAGGTTPRAAFAEARGLVSLIKDSAATSPITTQRLRKNVHVMEGSGGSVAVLSGPDGIILVDAGISVSSIRIKQALKSISDEPVTHLINTHWHFDHTDGNSWIGAAGVKIIAHSNTQKHLSTVERVSDWDYNFLPMQDTGLPTQVFGNEQTLKLNGLTIGLRHLAAAHTDSDIAVFFQEADVVHAGDTFWNGIYPFIDYSTGGSINGMIAATATVIASTTNDTIIIAGHGKAVGTRAELVEFRDMLTSVRERVSVLKAQGRSQADVVAARPTEAFDAKFGNFVIDPGFFTRLVFEGV